MQGFIEYALQFETPVAVLVVGAIALRAGQRGVNRTLYLALAVGGFLAGRVASNTGAGLWALGLRWLWLAGVFVYVERFTRGGRQMKGNWQCPDCLTFNDSTTLNCACGFAQPDPPAAE